MISEESITSGDVLCLFGVPDPEPVREDLARRFSLRGKKVVFFEEEGGIAHEDRIDFYEFSSLCKERAFQKFCYISVVDSPAVQASVQKCQSVQWQAFLEVFEYRDFGVKTFKNAMDNERRSSDKTSFASLKNALKGIPAFICGAGPSLREHMSRLKESERRGVFFSGGAALCDPNLPVHIAAGVDSDPSYRGTFLQGSFAVPFFYQNHAASDLLDSIQGPLFRVPSNPGREIQTWLESSSEECFFEGGWTVGTFCVALADYLGCNPLIFVGMDFAYSPEGNKYGGVPSEGNEETVVWKDSSLGDLVTQKDWVLAAKWLEWFVQNRQDTRFYTLSSSSLSIKGVERISWDELLNEVSSHTYDCTGAVHAIRASYREEKARRDYVKEDLQRALSAVDRILFLFEKEYPRDPNETGEFVLALFDLQEEIVYQKLLTPLWKAWRFSIEAPLPRAYEKSLNQFLFFKRVLEEYASVVV